MQPRSAVRIIGAAIIVGSVGISAAILRQAAPGSVYVQGNVVCNDVRNPNCGLISGTRSVVTPGFAEDTNSGGLVKDDYKTIQLCSPYNSSTASARGLRTGSGVQNDLQLDIIRNPRGTTLDCVLGPKILTSTASTTMIFDNIHATGSINLDSTTRRVIGPTQCVTCFTKTVPSASFSGTLKATFNDAEVVN